jgi:hypothetical protein
MKCHYTYDKEFGRVLIPGCWDVIITNDMELCTCRNEFPQSFEAFERKEFREILMKKDMEIGDLEKENAELNRIIKNLLKIK